IPQFAQANRFSNGFPPSDARAHLGRSMTHTAISHENQRPVVGSQDQTNILLRRPVCANQQQVRTCLWQDLSRKPITDKFSTGNSEHATLPSRCVSQL